MGTYGRLRQRPRECRQCMGFVKRVRRLVPTVANALGDMKWKCLLVSLFLIALVAFYPVNPNRYMVTVADGYVGVKLENTGEQLSGFKQTLETGIRLIVPHDGLLIFARSVIYRCEQTTQAIGGEPQNEFVSVIADPTYVTADAFVWTWDDPRDTEHTHDGQAIEIDLHDPLCREKGQWMSGFAN